jgi:hypothetical protein
MGISFPLLSGGASLLTGTSYPMGLFFSLETELPIENQCATVPDALTVQQCHVASEDPATDPVERDRVSKLKLDLHARQHAMFGVDQRAAR